MRRARMDRLTSAAASGLQARMDSLDMLANNLSNTSTGGFKADREFYGTYLAPELANQPNTVGEAPVVQRHWTDFSQGTLVGTGNPTDFGLSGGGFFSVNGPNGPLYTRNGNFHFSADGALVRRGRIPGSHKRWPDSADQFGVASSGRNGRASLAGRGGRRAVGIDGVQRPQRVEQSGGQLLLKPRSAIGRKPRREHGGSPGPD